jgi:phosphoribosylformylglycinamidine (FGAM) synthase-like enzyme
MHRSGVFGALVRACQACYDFAMYYRTPFISGKDSLSNEFSFQGTTIKIPHTLLITAMTVVGDVRRSLTMDAKQAGDAVMVVGLTRDELGGSEFLLELGGTAVTFPRSIVRSLCRCSSPWPPAARPAWSRQPMTARMVASP